MPWRSSPVLDLLAKTPRAHRVLEQVAQMAEWGCKRDGTGLGAVYMDYSDTQVATGRAAIQARAPPKREGAEG